MNGIDFHVGMRIDITMMAERMTPEQVRALMEGMAKVLAAGKSPRASGDGA